MAKDVTTVKILDSKETDDVSLKALFENSPFHCFGLIVLACAQLYFDSTMHEMVFAYLMVVRLNMLMMLMMMNMMNMVMKRSEVY